MYFACLKTSILLSGIIAGFPNNLTTSHRILSFPALQHGQVAFRRDGIFQAATPPALEEHHIPQEE